MRLLATCATITVLALGTVGCGGNSLGTTPDDGGGPDSSTLPDAATLPDGGAPLRCTAASVADDMCVDCDGLSFLGAFFDGLRCYEFWGCLCTDGGTGDCERGFDTLAECEAAHAGCDGVLCSDTGGEWYPAEPCGPCGHYDCGLAPLINCCDAGCNCGPGKRFQPGIGCVVDPACEANVACNVTGGSWHGADECFCGFTCGLPNDCQACIDSCDCGPHRNFDAVAGCVLDGASCPSPDEAGLCEATQGTWYATGNGCGHFTCGEPNLLDPCVAPGCDCGSYRNFDSQQGCVWDDTCILRGPGEYCQGAGPSSNCRPGLVCCASCGIGPGCSTCMHPCCDDSPGCQTDGCWPPPP